MKLPLSQVWQFFGEKRSESGILAMLKIYKSKPEARRRYGEDPENRLPAAVMFACTGLFLIIASGYEAPRAEIPVSDVLTVVEDSLVPAADFQAAFPQTAAAEAEEETTAEETEEAVREPELYLAGLYEEGQIGSFAELLLRELSEMDSAWFARMYDLAGSSGTVNIAFRDGDGGTAGAVSNIQDIVSMTGVYAEMTGLDDWKTLRNYAKELWKKSHSFSAGESSTYFCEGCEDPADSVQVSEGTAAASEETSDTGTVGFDAVMTPSDSTFAEGAALLSESGESESEVPMTEAVEPESGGALQETEESGSVAPLPEPETSESGMEETEKICPGHVSISVTAVIAAMEDENGLFELDTQGRETAEAGVWDGWNEDMRARAAEIRDQNWGERYGLSTAVNETYAPLSSAEIESYMSLLPADAGEERKNLVRFALQSVGKVPYYWGGKPRASGYEGNRFGVITVPDSQGRTMQGLDCSGWISWVYWSSGNGRLKYEGTGGLQSLGRAVTKEELKPGDIAVMTGNDSHAIMYLGEKEDGTMLCIHESSSRGTVSVSIMKSGWTNFRNLLD